MSVHGSPPDRRRDPDRQVDSAQSISLMVDPAGWRTQHNFLFTLSYFIYMLRGKTFISFFKQPTSIVKFHFLVPPVFPKFITSFSPL